MNKRKCLIAVAAVTAVIAGTAVAHATTERRFTDVAIDHPARDAIEWAFDNGITRGCGEEEFCPEQPLSKRHAIVFMERFYDNILKAEKSATFTRADMMQILQAINTGDTPNTKTTLTADGITVDYGVDPEEKVIRVGLNTDLTGAYGCASGLLGMDQRHWRH